MRLIDADALLQELPVHPDGGLRTIKEEMLMLRVRQTIEEAPTVIERPEIIRCKDCKYGYMLPDSSDYIYCTKPYSGTTSHKPDWSDWFCADGETRQ